MTIEANPYQPPQTPTEIATYPPGTLTLGKALAHVLAAAAVFAVLGALAGMLVGAVLPEYYQQLFNVSGGGRAVVAGMVLGFMQGGGAGIGVGLALAAIIAWLQARLRAIEALRH